MHRDREGQEESGSVGATFPSPRVTATSSAMPVSSGSIFLCQFMVAMRSLA